jgi:hypothetical protein
MAAEIGQELLSVVSSYSRKDMGGVLKGGMELIRTAGGSSQKIDRWAKTNRSSPADVVSSFVIPSTLPSPPSCRSFRRYLGVGARIRKPALTQSKVAWPRVLWALYVIAVYILRLCLMLYFAGIHLSSMYVPDISDKRYYWNHFLPKPRTLDRVINRYWLVSGMCICLREGFSMLISNCCSDISWGPSTVKSLNYLVPILSYVIRTEHFPHCEWRQVVGQDTNLMFIC